MFVIIFNILFLFIEIKICVCVLFYMLLSKFDYWVINVRDWLELEKNVWWVVYVVNEKFV